MNLNVYFLLEIQGIFKSLKQRFFSRVFMPSRASALAHWFLINFESRPKRLQEHKRGRGQNCRALFAYPVGCIISFQLHFRFELIKKCNFRLVVFSIECCPSRGTVAQSSCSQSESSWVRPRPESSPVEPLLKVGMTFRLKLPSMADARCPSLYMMYIYSIQLSCLFWHCYKSAHWPMQQVAASWAATGTGTSAEMGVRKRVRGDYELWTGHWVGCWPFYVVSY